MLLSIVISVGSTVKLVSAVPAPTAPVKVTLPVVVVVNARAPSIAAPNTTLPLPALRVTSLLTNVTAPVYV